MKIYLYLILHILILLFLFGCVNFEDDAPSFAIYFLKDSTLTMKDREDKNIDELKLSNNAWLTQNDIEFYDWSSHCIYLKKDKTFLFPNWENNNFNEFPPEWEDKPFVVVANGQRKYMGYFESMTLSSYPWIAPIISDGCNSGYPSDILFIDWAWFYHDSPLNNLDIKNALKSAELYHGGISVTFDTTNSNTMNMINNDDTSTISYQFTITNNDEDDLYVFDPNKMGSDLFHYFTNGPVFQNIENKLLYNSRYKEYITLPSYDYWSKEWFIKLESGYSINRTVTLKGYLYFPDGEYLFQFIFPGIIFGMEKDIRKLTDGRYWVGPTRSNVLVWNFNNYENPPNKIPKQKIFEKHNHFMYKNVPIKPTQQQLELKRRW